MLRFQKTHNYSSRSIFKNIKLYLSQKILSVKRGINAACSTFFMFCKVDVREVIHKQIFF